MAIGNPPPTKEIFYPCANRDNAHGNYACEDFIAGGSYYLNGFIPHDFTTIVSIALVFIPNATDAAQNIDIYSDYAPQGSLYNANTESDVASTYSVTANTTYDLDLSGIFSSPAADDYFGVRVVNGAGEPTMHVLGIRLRYV